ncbi:adenosine kinase [Albimonas pacifica]|uniref:Sugar or nucleoside kinase, ribokinase family n=1 Tax=Albimonas pacifica TaxID=1114924 RepID=A0A1I3PLX2_9RHOB|nr:adenosine kinase [Albimonas pacifica]SFJ22350.1 Sugar or nucleoside kinase, ribokinase family [Albimonas pacifica]
MSEKRFDVVGIGNAMVDVLGRVTDEFLVENGVGKGVMTLIDAERAIELYSKMGPAQEISGGSAANTIAGLGMLGAKAAYVGKIKDDQLGAIFAHDIRSLGVAFDTPMTPRDRLDEETGRCMVLVSPDGERSMNTYLGVSADLGPDDIDEGLMADTRWIYLEGYRFDGMESQEAFRKAVAATKAAGGKVSITLSDPFCIERHRDAFRRMVVEEVDLLFANEHELVSLYQTSTLEDAMDEARKEVEIVACTVGPSGAYVLKGERTVHAPAAPMKRVDATGAGDLFAAGFLYGLTRQRNLLTCGTMGCVCAGEVISHIGARPEENLKDLFARFGLA